MAFTGPYQGSPNFRLKKILAGKEGFNRSRATKYTLNRGAAKKKPLKIE
jgi:hypothetical protein